VWELGYYAGKSYNLIGQGIFHRDQKSRDLHEKSKDLSNYKIPPHKILKSQCFKMRAVYWYFYATLNIFSLLKLFKIYELAKINYYVPFFQRIGQLEERKFPKSKL
jgi:hypothetical protein